MEVDTPEQKSAYFSELVTKRHERRIAAEREAAQKLADIIASSAHLFTPEQASRAYEILRKGSKHYRNA